MTWMPWEQAWHLALYGQDGFYRRPEGPAGHFTTSAQGLGPGAGLLAQAVLELAARHDLRHIVEIAAGRGELLSALAARGAADSPTLTGLDIVARPAGLPAQIGWQVSPGGPALPETLTGLGDTLVLAHEWLDVVPCPVAQRDEAGVWRSVETDTTSGRERLGTVVQGVELDWLRRHAGAAMLDRLEIGLTRDLAFADLVSRVGSGLVVAVDYGHTVADRPPGGTLTAYRSGAEVTPVADGSCDLTAHVAVDSLGAERLVTQRVVLRELLGPAPMPDHELAGSDPAAYLGALARRSALTALTRPDGLGGFWWAMHGCGGVRLG